MSNTLFNDGESCDVIMHALETPFIGDSCDLGLSTTMRLAGSALLGNRAQFRRLIGERIKRITIKRFMDMHTMIEERLVQCCVHVRTASEAQHQCVPFCAAPNGGSMRRDEFTTAPPRAPAESDGIEGAPARRRMTRCGSASLRRSR